MLLILLFEVIAQDEMKQMSYDLETHKHTDVVWTKEEPLESNFTLITESSRDFNNVPQGTALNELLKLAYHQGGNLLYVQFESEYYMGEYTVNYKIYTSMKFQPELFDSYLGTFAIEGFNDGIKLDDWSDPLFTLLGVNEKLIFKEDGSREAVTGKRVYKADLSLDGDMLNINYSRVKKKGKVEEKFISIRIVGNDENQILALHEDSGYSLIPEKE